MSVRRVTPLGAAVLGIVVLAGAVAAFAHVRSTSSHRVLGLPACTPPWAGNHELEVQAGRAPVLLHVPRGRPRDRRPLILVLPGAGMTGSDMAHLTGYSRLADQRGFMVAYPTASGTRPFWNVSGKVPGRPDDVAYLRAVIDALTGPAGCADPGRVSVTGVSNGGGMAARLACDAADLLEGAAPVAGGYSTLPDCEPQRPLPILEIHSLQDHVVPYGGKPGSGAGAVSPWIQEWRGRDGCSGPAHRSTPTPRVLELRWACQAGIVVAHDRVFDGPHGWPGNNSLRPFSTTLRTWRFLNSFVNEAGRARRRALDAAAPRPG